MKYEWNGVRFEAPLPLAGPEDIGLDAAAFQHGEFELVLVRVPLDLAESFGGERDALVEYVKATFLGASQPPVGGVERRLLGASSQGQVLKVSIPRPGSLEFHLAPAPGGGFLAVAFRLSGASAPAEAEDAILAISASLALA
jgi:hypothetical protein